MNASWIFVANKINYISVNKCSIGTKETSQRKTSVHAHTEPMINKNYDFDVIWSGIFLVMDGVDGETNHNLSIKYWIRWSLNRTPLQVHNRMGNCMWGSLCTLITQRVRWFCSLFLVHIKIDGINSHIVNKEFRGKMNAATRTAPAILFRLHLSAHTTSTKTNRLTKRITLCCVRFLRSFQYYIYIRCVFFFMKMIRFCFYGSAASLCACVFVCEISDCVHVYSINKRQ